QRTGHLFQMARHHADVTDRSRRFEAAVWAGVPAFALAVALRAADRLWVFALLPSLKSRSLDFLGGQPQRPGAAIVGTAVPPVGACVVLQDRLSLAGLGPECGAALLEPRL